MFTSNFVYHEITPKVTKKTIISTSNYLSGTLGKLKLRQQIGSKLITTA